MISRKIFENKSSHFKEYGEIKDSNSRPHNILENHQVQRKIYAQLDYTRLYIAAAK